MARKDGLAVPIVIRQLPGPYSSWKARERVPPRVFLTLTVARA